MQRMGFEDRLKVTRVMPGEKVTATVGGKRCHFRSLFEYRWSQYLEFLKQAGEIKDWLYEPTKFDFWEFGYRNKPYEYTPDFKIIRNDESEYYQELKGYIETKDISRIKRTLKHYDAEFEFVLMKKPNRGKRSQIIARAETCGCVRRIIDASEIFKQIKGLINWNPPIVGEI